VKMKRRCRSCACSMLPQAATADSKLAGIPHAPLGLDVVEGSVATGADIEQGLQPTCTLPADASALHLPRGRLAGNARVGTIGAGLNFEKAKGLSQGTISGVSARPRQIVIDPNGGPVVFALSPLLADFKEGELPNYPDTPMKSKGA